jgi:hypothetical protein
MAGQRQPGHLCTSRQVVDVEDGTMCRAATSPPGYSCSLQKPISSSHKDERAHLHRQVVDMRWHKAEALAIWKELKEKQLRASKILQDQAADQAKSLAKAASGSSHELQEWKELSHELLELAKKGAKTAHLRGKLASRIRQFLHVSALKGKANRRALGKLNRDLWKFGSKHSKSLVKSIGKGIVIDLFLKWSRDFILATGKQQLESAGSPGEVHAAQFLIFDAMVLDAGDKICDIRVWNAHSFWRGVYSSLSKDHRDGKLNSASAVWNAWSRAVTQDEKDENPVEEAVPVAPHLLDARIREAQVRIGARP